MSRKKKTVQRKHDKKNEAKKAKKKGSTKPKNSYKSNKPKALESLFGSIKKESKNWGKKTKEMIRSALPGNNDTSTGKPYSRKRQRNGNDGGKKAGQQKFRFKMPPVVPTGQIPWWSNPTSAPSFTERMKIFDAISVDPHSMWLLNQELMTFSNYVQLSPQESNAREHLINTIQDISRELFGIEESDCQVFGSYAARPVCTFESDIDLSIWGIVACKQQEKSSDRGDDESLYDTMKQPPPIMATDALIDDNHSEHPNAKKQHKILKWKAAIDEFERQKELKEQSEGEDKKKKASESFGAGKEPTTKPEEREASLFVIDREGDTLEEEKKSDDLLYQFAAADEPLAKGIEGETPSAVKSNREEEDDKNDSSIVKDSDSSSDDTAHKLEGMKVRKFPQADSIDAYSGAKLLALPDAEGIESTYDPDDLYGDAEEDDEEEALITKPRARPRSHSLISLSSSTTCSDNQSLDETGLEVSFITQPSCQRRRSSSGDSARTDEETRALIVRKLNLLGKRIRKTGVATMLHVRKKARVPIINMETRYGYECDIALGGHNGTDTSSYASTKISQHPCFAPVVLILKIILNQHGLDKPFTGGLGSFKLYVLVANHIDRHLAQGGSDSPAEILFMFLFRYGGIRAFLNIGSLARTDLNRIDEVRCKDGGSADIGAVFQIDNCIKVFEACWWQLKTLLETKTRSSMLRTVIDANSLRRKREVCHRMTEQFKRDDHRLHSVASRPRNHRSPRHSTAGKLASDVIKNGGKLKYDLKRRVNIPKQHGFGNKVGQGKISKTKSNVSGKKRAVPDARRLVSEYFQNNLNQQQKGNNQRQQRRSNKKARHFGPN